MGLVRDIQELEGDIRNNMRLLEVSSKQLEELSSNCSDLVDTIDTWLRDSE